MSKTIYINVINAHPSTQSFFFYVGQAQYCPVSSGIYAQSLASETVAPSGNASLKIPFDYYAAAQSVDSTQSMSSAIRQISLSQNDSTAMSTNPLALTPPVFNSNVPAGAFRIVVPSYDSNSETYYVGTGLQSQSGLVILTSYIVANPNTQVNVTPTKTFYVAIGDYKTGQQIPSQVSNYGKCDASAKSAFKVTYKPDGTFAVESFTRPWAK